MKKGLTSIIFYIFLIFLTVPLGVNAREYTLLAPLPLNDGAEVETVNFKNYIEGMYQFALGVAGILAVIMIIFAGFTYMTTDAFQEKNAGRERIKNAILGLLLAIGTWIILNTINPDLLNFELKIDRPSITAPTQTTTLGTGTVTVVTADEKAARETLEKYNLETNKSECINGQTTGCANFDGIPESTFAAVADLQNSYCNSGATNCQFNLSGGSEDGHDTHGINQPIVDLSYNSDYSDYVKENGTFVKNTNIGPIYKLGDTQITIEHENTVCSATSGPCQHFHVVVGQ